MKNKTLIFVVSGIAVAALAVWAEPGIGGRGEGRTGPQGFAGRGAGMFEARGGFNREDIFKRALENPELAKRVGVTEDQIKKIKDGQFAFEKQMITMRADAEAAKLEVRHLMESEKVDRDAVSKAIDAAAAKESTLRKTELLRMLDVKEVLGAETIKKIKDSVREHMAERMEQAEGPGLGNGVPGNERPWVQQFRRGQGQVPQGGATRDGGDKSRQQDKPMRPPQG